MLLRRALDFIEVAEASRTLEELQAALQSTLETFGVPNFSMLAMISDAPGEARTPHTLLKRSDEGWAEHYWESKAFNADAAVHLALQRPNTFAWRELENRRLPPRSRALFDEIRDSMHIDGGLVIPTHDEEGFAGLVALYHERDELPPEARRVLKLISIYAIERGKELYRGLPRDKEAPCPLTMRQREIMAFAAAGKSDWDIGQILGIASDTVSEHLERARHLLGVKTRTQAVAIAVQRGWIML